MIQRESSAGHDTVDMRMIGLAAGVPAALACARLVACQLYGLKPTDPLMLPQTEPVLFTGLRPSIARKSCQNWYSAGVIPFARRYISAEARW